LNLLDLKEKRDHLEYILLELEDSVYPLLLKATITEELKDAFMNIDLAILMGGNPRKPGKNYIIIYHF